MGSRYFEGAGAAPLIPHHAKATKEVGDLRNDVEEAFVRVESEIDTLQGGPVTKVDFTPVDPSIVTYQEGRVFYDSHDQTLDVMTDVAGVTLQIGQEMYVRAVNKTGAPIANGAVVYLTDTPQGNRPTIALADADSDATSHVLGIATHNISDNQAGMVTTYGLVRDLNTDAWAPGTKLYLSSTPGQLTATKPTGTTAVVEVAQVVVQHLTQGSVFLFVETPDHLSDMHDVQDGTPTSGNILVGTGTAWNSQSYASTSAQLGYVQPVDTLANLALIVATSYPNGAQIYVLEVADTYILDKVGTHTQDGVTVIAAAGGGYWIARQAGRWDDVQGSISQGAGAAALTVEAFRDTAFLMWFLRHDQDDSLNFIYQFPHRWDYTRPVIPHLHVLPASNPAAAEVAYFTGYYVWSRPNNTNKLPALSGWTNFTPISVTINPGDDFIQKIASLGTITPPSWARGSTCLLVWFRRNGTSINDTYTTGKTGGTAAANLGLVSADVHYRIGTDGSETEIPT